MTLDSNWVPMKWPCGPLELARRSKSQNLTADLKDALAAWGQPSALELLKGTPINCLVVEWARGEPEDPTQQHVLKPLLEAGRGLGINFVGRVADKANVGAAVAAGRAAGLSAIILASPPSQSLELPAILEFPREKVRWETTSSIFSMADNVWPGLGLETMKGDVATAGPTGVPWVNSNAWVSLLARELTGGKTAWLDFDPPAGVLHAADYCLAIADCRTYGSRWIVSLPDKLRAAIARRNAGAISAWGKICEAAGFFENHREWETFKSQGILAVISDFRGDNAYMSGEVLNLLNRRQVQFQIIERSAMLSTPIEHLRAILWLDKEDPTARERSKLLGFVRQGGLLIASAYWGDPGVKQSRRDPSLRYNMYAIGQGQIAAAEEAFRDPDQVASDAHLLVSRRNDLVRLYNPASTNCRSSLDPTHKKRLVQVLNYSSSPANFVTLWVSTAARSARLWNFETKTFLPLRGAAALKGTDFRLPPVSVYCALEFEA